MANYYKWIVTVSSMVNFMIIIGVVKSSGVFYVALYQRYGATKSEAAFISISMAGSMIATSALGGFTVHNFGYRKPLIVGSTLAFIGVISSYFVKDPFYLIFTFGIVQGLGYGIMFTPNMSVTSQYFQKNVAKANGLSLSGACAGTLIFPVIIEYVIEMYGFRGMFLILSGIVLQTIVASSLIRDPATHRSKELQEELSDNKGHVNNAFEESVTGKQTGSVSINATFRTVDKTVHLDVKNQSTQIVVSQNTNKQGLMQRLKIVLKKEYLIGISLAYICLNISLSLFYTTIPAIAVDNGESSRNAALLISITSACDLLSRLSFGTIVDRGYLNIGILYGFIILAFGVVHIFIGIFEGFTYEVLAVMSGVYGLSYGCTILMIPATSSHYYGSSYVSIVISISALCSVAPTFCVAPLIALVHDLYGSYYVLYLSVGAFITSVSLVWFFIGTREIRISKSSQATRKPTSP
ncbi:Uncharacterised protein r2_g2010 [Pycnogonum litorale]